VLVYMSNNTRTHFIFLQQEKNYSNNCIRLTNKVFHSACKKEENFEDKSNDFLKYKYLCIFYIRGNLYSYMTLHLIHLQINEKKVPTIFLSMR
jgi:hypothetical protein